MENITNKESQEVSPFPADEHKATRNRQDSMTQTILEWSVRKLLEGLNMFNGTNLTLSSDVDQDAYGKVTKIQGNSTHKRLKRSAL